MRIRHRPFVRAVLAYARTSRGLSDQQVSALFDELLNAAPHDSPQPSPRQLARFTDSLLSDIDADERLSQKMAANLRARLQRAGATYDPGMSAHTWWALNRIAVRADSATAAITELIGDCARALRWTRADTADAFTGLMHTCPGHTRHGMHDTRIPADPATSHAAATLTAHRDAALALAPVRRVVQMRPMPAGRGDHIQAMGYDQPSGRLELAFTDRPGRTYGYLVDADLAAELAASPQPYALYREVIRGSSRQQYRTIRDLRIGAVTILCPTCDQFTAADHTCHLRSDHAPSLDLFAADPSSPEPAAATDTCGQSHLSVEDVERIIATEPDLTVTAAGATGASGRTFGIEIEYDFPAASSPQAVAAANRAIGRALFRMGFTATMSMLDDSSGPATTCHERGWRLVNDDSCAGELVSPIMGDTEQTWSVLTRICATLRRYGAVPGPRAGFHVHVGTGDFGADGQAYLDLLAHVQHNEDVLYRIATNPSRGVHRGADFCAQPLQAPQHVATAMDAAGWQDGDRDFAINLQNVHGRATDHVELRLFDATLDPALMQAHILVAVGITEAAASGLRPPQPQHRALLGEHSGTSSSDQRSCNMVHTFVNRYFATRDAREQVAALFARTRWQDAPET